MSQLMIGTIAYRRSERPDAALAKAVHRLQVAGLRIGGLLQQGSRGDAARCASLLLQDIGSGRQIPLFESRGAGARGCRINPSGLAEAAGWLQEAVDQGVDLLFVNRFGRQESEGGGLRGEIAAAIMAGIPIIIAVDEEWLTAWRVFIGDADTPLEADAERITTWCFAQVPSLAA